MKLALRNLYINLKSLLRGERKLAKKWAKNSKEVQYCKEYDIQGIFVK
jgi:hypothetical protein